MSYRVKAVEAPSRKLGALLWDGGEFETYESALLAAAKYMHEESLDFGGNPDVSIQLLVEYFDIKWNSKWRNETYLEWVQRIKGDDLDETDLPDPDISSEVYLENMTTKEILHRWKGSTVFHPVRGLCTVYVPKGIEDY